MRIFIFLIFCISLSLNLNSQVVDCGPYTTNFTDIECIDEHLIFTVTSNNVNSFTLFGIPAGVNVSSADEFQLNEEEFLLMYNGTFVVNMPSPGCVPLNLSYFTSAPSNQCSGNIIIEGAPIAPIPTLGQWMILILSCLVTIFGILSIRGSITSKAGQVE